VSPIDPTLSNPDLRPTQLEARTWSTCNYIALWFSMSMEITTYQLASSLIAKGMDWKQAVGTVLLGNLIALVLGVVVALIGFIAPAETPDPPCSPPDQASG
jgi:NCS1 family nucleobase:cation symporter-1